MDVTIIVQPQPATNVSASANVARADRADKLTTPRTIALAGDVSGSASFDGSENATLNATIANGPVDARIAAAAGVSIAPLDAGGKVPAANLPSYVDDVLEYADIAELPSTGEQGKIYVTLDDSKIYRWSGSIYVEMKASPGSTDAVPEGATNQYFTPARAQAAVGGVIPPQAGNGGKVLSTNGVAASWESLSGVATKTTITGNGTSVTFPLAGATGISNPAGLIVSIDGMVKEPSVDYSVSGGNITFTTAPANGAKAVVVSIFTGVTPASHKTQHATGGTDALTPADIGALPLSGGALTGPLALAGDPSANLHAATKQYVDTKTAAALSIPVRQTVLSGPADSNGLPSLLPATSASLSLTSQNISSITPLIVAAAGGFGVSGAIDRVGKVITNLTWAGLVASIVNYLYVDIFADGTMTAGSTIFSPFYGVSSPQNYGADVTATGFAISSGDYNGTMAASNAFNNGAGDWESNTGAVNGAGYIGQNFGAGNGKHIRRIRLLQYSGGGYNVSSVKIQFSDNGSTWTDAGTYSFSEILGTYNVFDVPSTGVHQYWRILANSTVGNYWQVQEIEMLESAAPTAGWFYFNPVSYIGYVSDGVNYNPAYRVFVGEATTGASTVTSTVAYAYQGKFETVFPSPAASTNTTYSHNIGMLPRHVRTFMVCTTTEAGWAVGEEVDIQGPSFSSGYVVSGNPVSCIGRNTARYTQGDINPRLASISSPGTYINSVRANWSVKSILQRGW